MPIIFGLIANNSVVIPPGSIHSFGGGSVPLGWLLCDGSVVSQTTYAALFTNIGTGYNTGGEGAGNFRLPDYRGRSILGAGTGTGLTARSIGQYLGEENHVLSLAESPIHSHVVDSHSHGGGSHGHTYTSTHSQGLWQPAWLSGETNGETQVGSGGINASGTIISAEAPGTNQVGSSNSHNTIHPVLVATVIIKY